MTLTTNQPECSPYISWHSISAEICNSNFIDHILGHVNTPYASPTSEVHHTGRAFREIERRSVKLVVAPRSPPCGTYCLVVNIHTILFSLQPSERSGEKGVAEGLRDRTGTCICLGDSHGTPSHFPGHFGA